MRLDFILLRSELYVVLLNLNFVAKAGALYVMMRHCRQFVEFSLGPCVATGTLNRYDTINATPKQLSQRTHVSRRSCYDFRCCLNFLLLFLICYCCYNLARSASLARSVNHFAVSKNHL